MKLDLPKDFTIPQGMAWEWDQNSPELAQFKQWVVESKLTQDQATKAVGIYAAAKLGEAKAFADARAAELAKLGATATSRVDNIATFIRGHLGEDGAKALLPLMATAASVQHFERLMSLYITQGSASFRQDNREPMGGPQRVSEDQWERMTSAQRLDYARQFAQDQFHRAS